jgi:four helix bundle protein
MTIIKTFRDLKVWQKSHELTLLVYRFTAGFPVDERYGVTSQVRRAAVSVASNIVEGFNRASTKNSLHFYNMARASLEEMKYQCLVARDLNYLTKEKYQTIISLSEEVGRMLNAWSKSQKNSSTS